MSNARQRRAVKERKGRTARVISYQKKHAVTLAKLKEKEATKRSYNTYRNKWFDFVGKHAIVARDLTDENMAVFVGSMWETLPCSPSQIV